MTIKFSKLAIAFGSVLSSAQLLAQPLVWTISYAPQATSVPTLSEWAMLLLVLLLAAFAVYTLRKKGAGAGPLASVLLVSALALGAMTGEKLIGHANAITRIVLATMSNPAGGTVSPPILSGIETEVANGSGVVQTITGVTPASSPITTPGHTTCTVSLVVQPGASCWVWDGGRNPA